MSPRRLLSHVTPARFGVALLAAGLLGAVGFAYLQLRETRELQDDVAGQRRQLAELRKERRSESPLEGLFSGSAGSDLLGGGGDQLASCAGSGGGLLGGGGGSGGGGSGGSPDLEKLFEGIGKGGRGGTADLERLFEGIGKGGGKAPKLDELFRSLGGAAGAGSSGSEASADPAQLVAETAQQVERLRKLRFERRPRAELLDGEAIRSRVSDLYLEDYSREIADRDARVLAALGAVPPDTDMRALRLSALQSQVAGLYVPETGELLVRSSGSLGALERIVIAHELEHALADQVLDLPLPEDPDPAQADAELAALAIVEGDATLTMTRYSLQALELTDLLGLTGDVSTLLQAQEQLDELPHYVKQELTFPYTQGLTLVCDRFEKGGWKAVNGLYEDPPTATDQVLFPDRYGQGEPSEPPAPGRLGDSWSRTLSTQLGAAQLTWLFEAPGGRTSAALPDPQRAAAAWGGGRLELWEDGDRSALGVALRERDGEDGLCESITSWYSAAFPDADDEDTEDGERIASDGEAQDAVVTCDGDEVKLGVAPDLDTARELAPS